MKLEVIQYREDSCGNGILELELDEEAKGFLVERGINKLLGDALNQMSQLSDDVKEHNKKHMLYMKEYQKWWDDDNS